MSAPGVDAVRHQAIQAGQLREQTLDDTETGEASTATLSDGSRPAESVRPFHLITSGSSSHRCARESRTTALDRSASDIIK